MLQNESQVEQPFKHEVRCREPGCGAVIATLDRVLESLEEREWWEWSVERKMRVHYPMRHLKRWIELKRWLGEAGAEANRARYETMEPKRGKLWQDLRHSLESSLS